MKLRKFGEDFIHYYLRIFAKLQLYKTKPVIVGIGGASGKSSLTHLIYLILSDRSKVLYSPGRNSSTGIPLSILGIDLAGYSYYDWFKLLFISVWKLLTNWKRYDYYLAEMGIDGPNEPKNMSYLLKIIKPQIGVLTNISFEHSVYFEDYVSGSPEEKEKKIFDLTAEEERLLLLNSKEYVILNMDDQEIRKVFKTLKLKEITVSQKDSDLRIAKVKTSLSGFEAEFEHLNKNYTLKLSQPLTEHYSYSIALAIAVCLSLGVPIEESIDAIERKFALPNGRMSVFKGIKGTTIIDSSYNSSPIPLFNMLDFLKEIKGRRVAILGDMRELGILSQKFHEEAARKIIETCDSAILIGPLMKEFAYPILSKAKFNAFSFDTFAEAKGSILNSIKEGDVILVKGSQNTLFLERAVEMLLKDKKDVNNLCRRGKYWDKRRDRTL